MRYVIKQRLLSLTDSFVIKDDDGHAAYTVRGKLLSLGDRLVMDDADGQQVASMREEVISLTPSYRIRKNGGLVADINKRMVSLLRDRFRINMKDGTPDIRVEGNILDHQYVFRRVTGEPVAEVSKKWVSVRDSYGLTLTPGDDPILVIACAVVIDMVSHNPVDAPDAS